MASDNEACCESDPNFAVICAFLEKFGITCGLTTIDFLQLQEMLENTVEVPQFLIDLHIKLLRKSRKTVSNERWEKAVIKFCYTFCVQDAWEFERFGYKKARLSSKLRVLKELLELQFDYNVRFKSEINKMSAEELRSQPLGKDKHGHAYWMQNDNSCQIRVYKEDPDEETWSLVAKDRDGLVSLINELSDGDSKISSESTLNEEDSNSLAEKPIIDTGQVDSTSSGKSLDESSNESKNISVEPDDNAQMASVKKRSRSSSEEDVKVCKKVVVSEEIEEPLMLVKGLGSGVDNESPIVGEVIEEECFYVVGVGSGADCLTGKGNSNVDKTKNEAKSSSIKLGTILDTKTDSKGNAATKSPQKKSRWDVETIIAKTPQPDEESGGGRVKDMVQKWESIQNEEQTVAEETPKKQMFFFGPGCFSFQPKSSATPSSSANVAFGLKVPTLEQEELHTDNSFKDDLLENSKADVGYRISSEKNEENCDLNTKVTSDTILTSNAKDSTSQDIQIEEKLLEDNIPSTSIIKEPEENSNVILTSLENEIVPVNEQTTSEDLVDSEEKVPLPHIEPVCIKKVAYIVGEDNINENTEEVSEKTEDKTLKEEDAKVEPKSIQNEVSREEATPVETDIAQLESIIDEKEVSKEIPIANENIEQAKPETEASNEVLSIETLESSEKIDPVNVLSVESSKSSEEEPKIVEITANLENTPTEEIKEPKPDNLVISEEVTHPESSVVEISSEETLKLEDKVEEPSKSPILETEMESPEPLLEITSENESKNNAIDQIEDSNEVTKRIEETSSEILKVEACETVNEIKDSTEVTSNETKTLEVLEKKEESKVEVTEEESHYLDIKSDQKDDSTEVKTPEVTPNKEEIESTENLTIEEDNKEDSEIPESEVIEKSSDNEISEPVDLQLDNNELKTQPEVTPSKEIIEEKSQSTENKVSESIELELDDKNDSNETKIQSEVIPSVATKEEEPEFKLDNKKDTNEIEIQPEVIPSEEIVEEKLQSSKDEVSEPMELELDNKEDSNETKIQPEVIPSVVTKEEPEFKLDNKKDTKEIEIQPEVIPSEEIVEEKLQSSKDEVSEPIELELDNKEDSNETKIQPEVIPSVVTKEEPEFKLDNKKDTKEIEIQPEVISTEEIVEEKSQSSENEVSEPIKLELDNKKDSKEIKIQSEVIPSEVIKEEPEMKLDNKEEVITNVEVTPSSVNQEESSPNEPSEVLVKLATATTHKENNEEETLDSSKSEALDVSLRKKEDSPEVKEVLCESLDLTKEKKEESNEIIQHSSQKPQLEVLDLKMDQEEVSSKIKPQLEITPKDEITKTDEIKAENFVSEENKDTFKTKTEEKCLLSREEIKITERQEQVLEENDQNQNKSKILEIPTEEKTSLELKSDDTNLHNENGPKNEEESKPKRSTRSSQKNEDTPEPPIVETPVVEIVTPRRGRPRTFPKTDDNTDTKTKKMKLSTEPPRQTRSTLKESPESSVSSPESFTLDNTCIESDQDPLAISEEEDKSEKKTLQNFSLDFNETSPVPRRGKRRKHDSNPQSAEDVTEEITGKRPKMKGKRTIDVKLRKSIEEQKKKDLISSDDDNTKTETETNPDINQEEQTAAKKKGRPKLEQEEKLKNKNKRLLNSLGIDPNKFPGEEPIIGVRQSRRIAQIKIKEEAERRKLEEDTFEEIKKKKSKKSEDKDYKVEKKRPKNETINEEDVAEDDSNDSKKRKKKKKKNKKLFDEFNPWRSSSDSSTSNAEEDEEEIAEESEEELQYVSDHEFSPESDMEGDGEALPLKRARTARKESDVEEVDDCPCQKCGKSDHPEWILLCDRCDTGWHCSCLRPPLLVIPEGDWYCPPCQHVRLLQKLQEKLSEFDKKLSKKEMEDRRKQRLAYVGISLNNVLPTKEGDSAKKRRRDSLTADLQQGSEQDESSSDESESGSVSGSESSDSDEPIYQLRQRRQSHSYRFNDYDALINSAIQDEMESVKVAGNQGRGKDIATIVNAENPEDAVEEQQEKAEETLPEVEEPEVKQVYSDDEPIKTSRKLIGRKKHRKLNSLDFSSGDDEDSDEDFKGTSSDSEDDFDDDLGSDDSAFTRRRKNDPIRRSTRARTSRYDADFIDDGDSDDSEEAPKRKKKRPIWDETESEESDRSWGRRKKRPSSAKARKPTTAAATSSSKKKKSKKKKEDSDAEVYRKKKPKIKFGIEDEDGPVRRTRGRKINYVDALGSDSDEDRIKRAPPRIESEEEYVANEEEEDEDEKVSEEESSDEKRIYPESNQKADDDEEEANPIDDINKNLEEMDENEMEKMMEEEEYANKQLQLVALQIEKEKKRKEREAKRLIQMNQEEVPKKRGRKPKSLFEGTVPESENLMTTTDNDDLSEPPGLTLPLFAELTSSNDGTPEDNKKRKARSKKSLEETVANLGTTRPPQDVPLFMGARKDQDGGNIEIAAPPQPFAQSQPTPSVITRMLQSKPGQPGYPVGTIRPKQFAAMSEREEEGVPPLGLPIPHQYIPGGPLRPQMGSPYRPIPAALSHYPRGGPHAIRNPVPQSLSPHIYHSHRVMDPSPSGGGAITIPEHSGSPGRVVSPASGSPKNDTPPPPYVRGQLGRFALGPRHLHMGGPPHLQAPRPNVPPYHGGYHYGPFGPQQPMGASDDAMPPTVYQYGEFGNEGGGGASGQVNQSENSNSKSYDEESGGEFGGLVSYFSSQREDDMES